MDSAPKQLCSEILARSVEFLLSEEYCDCSFLVGTAPHQETISSYKLILALTSPVFEAMVYGCLAENSQQIPIPDVHPEEFKALLTYIYTNEVVVNTFEQASGLYYGAKKYMLANLQERCSNYFLSKLDASNACQVFEYAQLFDDAKLTEEANKVLAHSTKQVLNSDSFEKIQLSTLKHIFSLEKLNIDSEMDLLEAAARYHKAQSKDTESEDDVKIRDAIENIRFLTLTPKQFTESKAALNLLQESEIRAILSNITSSDAEHMYPTGLSKSRLLRLQDVEVHNFSFTIQDFRNFDCMVCSPPYYIRDLPWTIVVSAERFPYKDQSQGKQMEVQLMCNHQSKSTKWSCKATFELKLCSQNHKVTNISSSFSHEFTESNWLWGKSNFAPLKVIQDPKNGFIKNGAITIDVIISAEPPKIG